MTRIWKRRATKWTFAAAFAATMGASSVTAHAADPKIPLSPSMVINEIARGDAGRLVDEQTLAGDPANGNGGSPLTSWSISYGRGELSWYYPLTAVIDLGATYNITSISLRDLNSSGTVTISTGTPFNWTPALTQNLDQYNTWRVNTVNVTTRFLRVSIGSDSATMSEIVLNGTKVADSPPPTPPATVTRLKPLMEDFIGANAFNDDPIDKLQAVGFLREYNNWSWVEKGGTTFPNNQKVFNPANSGFRLDEFYLKAQRAGLSVAPAIKETIPALVSDGNMESKPVPVGENPLLPQSYRIHADHMYQYAARYGHTSVPGTRLKTAPDQARTTNAKLIKYYENWNEPNKWWTGRAGYFTPYELAAMCSADYDGHMGTMGSTYGVKNADPSAKMSMGGLAGLDLDYLKAMKLWADYNRNGQFPADVINVHHYSNDTGGQDGATQTGISPEADNLKGKLEQLVQWRNANVPHAELWLSEFGYDVNQASPQRAPAYGPFSGEDVQAMWMVRSYMAIAAAGVDKAQMYMFRDVDANDGGKYSSSGLVTMKGQWTPRASWYHISTLTKRLRGMRFDKVVSSGNPNVLVYQFKNERSSQNAYVVWCPTSNNTTVANYQLPVRYDSTGLARVDMVSGDADGVEAPLTMVNGRVTINVSEKPVLVVTANNVWLPTEVKITSPTDGAKFGAPATFNVDVSVTNNSNPINRVEFLRNNVLVGSDLTAPYSLPMSNLAAGVYALKARSIDSVGAWSTSPEIKVIVPSGTGLKAQYFSGSNFETLVRTQIDPTINFDWGWTAFPSSTSLNHNAFSVRWTGEIQALESGTYNFRAHYNDAVRVWIHDGTNEQTVIDRWTAGTSTFYWYGGSIYLQAGQKYTIKTEYAQRGPATGNDQALVRVQWLPPKQDTYDFIPQSQLYPAP